MGIASGIFWILFGAAYIYYRVFKDNPTETLAGTVIVFGVVGGIVAFYFLLDWLSKANIWLGMFFLFGSVGFGLYKFFKMCAREERKRQAWREEHEAWMSKVRANMTEKDYEDYARKNYYRYGASMNANSWNYWKKEPYYSKIADMAEIMKSIEMRKEECENA